MPQKIIFLHHSTGEALFYEGNVPEYFSNYNSQNQTDYQITEKAYPDSPYPWENYPYDYWNLWINNQCNSSNSNIECLTSLCSKYNVIVFKHCYPGADILIDDENPLISSSKKTLANYKLQYRALRDLMDSHPNNKFIVWTLVPLHRLATSPENAERAREFVNWVLIDWLNEDGKGHPNIYIFDFYKQSAESDLSPSQGKVNCLKYEYEKSHTGNDSHPNLLANETIGPIFAKFVIDCIQGVKQIYVANITITAAGGVTSISTNKGTLQFFIDILPVDATNKSVTWSVENNSGEATIDHTGLLTAVKNGNVTVKASAVDGSGVIGSYILEIENQSTISVCDFPKPALKHITFDQSALTVINPEINFYNKIFIYNVLGCLVYEQSLDESTLTLNISGLSKGEYIVVLKGNKFIFRDKILVR
ncbi:MAG: Ig-like domain-containing protein [Bacteroidales bacterium]|nr:Ig-like domain-containing protein [Bacteroidales bacterium]